MAGALSPIGGVVLEYIHFLPSMLVLGVTVLLFGGAAFAAPFAGRRLLGLKDNRTRDAAVFDAFLAVMAMAGVVLAFSLVQADGNLRADQADVGEKPRPSLPPTVRCRASDCRTHKRRVGFWRRSRTVSCARNGRRWMKKAAAPPPTGAMPMFRHLSPGWSRKARASR